MADADLAGGADEVWSDLAATVVIGLPAWTMTPLALAGLILEIVALRRGRRRGQGE